MTVACHNTREISIIDPNLLYHCACLEKVTLAVYERIFPTKVFDVITSLFPESQVEEIGCSAKKKKKMLGRHPLFATVVAVAVLFLMCKRIKTQARSIVAISDMHESHCLFVLPAPLSTVDHDLDDDDDALTGSDTFLSL